MFKNRVEAGKLLAEKLEKYSDTNPVILALPRGGVPLGFEISKALKAPLDVILVRKIGAPMSPELAAGAVVDGEKPQLVLNDDIVKLYNIPQKYLEDRKNQQLKEIEKRRRLYREGHAPIDISGKTVIVVDDGIATGATVRAALKGISMCEPDKLVLAVPVAPREAIVKLKKEADEIICLESPEVFFAIGQFYNDFNQVTDEEVTSLLKKAEAFSEDKH